MEKKDVEEAVRLTYAALRLSAIDPKTGLLDPDLLTTGTSARERKEAAEMQKALRQMLSRKSVESMTRDEILQELRGQSTVAIRAEDFDIALNEIVDESTRMSFRNGVVYFEKV